MLMVVSFGAINIRLEVKRFDRGRRHEDHNPGDRGSCVEPDFGCF